ncbi:hypothetical protein CUU52_14995 [Pectobacterium polaris]|nr:hypothetical protein [Pectobacterium polaris]
MCSKYEAGLIFHVILCNACIKNERKNAKKQLYLGILPKLNATSRYSHFSTHSLFLFHTYPSSFKLHVRWLRSVTRITYLSKLIGTPSLAACLKLELFRV